MSIIPYSHSERMRASLLGFLAKSYNNTPNRGLVRSQQVCLPRPTTPSAWMMAAPEWNEPRR